MTDSKEELICPACQEKMVKIYTKSGMNVDICLNGCGGIWFDNREMDYIAKHADNFEEIQSKLGSKNFQKVKISQDRICPVCGKKMVQHQASSVCEVVIDECYTCGGKFLDYGELEKIENSANSQEESIKAVVNAMYRENGIKHYQAKPHAVRDFLGDVYKKFI